MRRVRVKTEDSAYVYAILESHEGAVSYSTLDAAPDCPYRDLELQIPLGCLDEALDIIERLGDLVQELPLD